MNTNPFKTNDQDIIECQNIVIPQIYEPSSSSNEKHYETQMNKENSNIAINRS